MKSETLGNFWNHFCELAVLQRQWPTNETLATLPALQSCDHDCAQRLERRFEFVHSFSILPIVAVAGLKNAGKSSLISTFVSPANRDRIPRGQKSDFGTHRFTLWLPQSWEANTDRLAQIKSTLAEVFGHAAEALSDSAEDAIRQQTRRDAIEKPLLAFDAALEEQGIALLDCPDIDSASGDTPENNARLRMLTRAGEVCAGVIIVIERAKIEVDLLSVIAQHLPAAAQVYAINAVRNEPPHEVLDDLVRRLGHRPQYCYLAFDFAVEGYRERTPRIDPNIDNDFAAKLVKLPFFFEVFPEKEKNLPGKDIVTSERSILGLGKRLDPEKLLQNRQRELLRELQTDLRRGIIVIETNIRVGGEVVQNAATKLFNTCKDLFSEGDQSTVKLDLESIKAIADSLQRTATWEFKLLLWPCRGALSLLDNAKEKLGEIKKWIHSKRGDSAIPSASTRLTSSNLCQALAEWSAACGSVRVAAVWEEDAQEILNRFSKEERTILADSEWDEATSKLWEGTPKWKQRIALVTGLVAGLLALASAIADFLGGMGFFTVTYAKLLSILGIGGGAAALGETGWRFRKLFAKLTKQQISNFFAITADRIGVPRTVPETFQDEFPAPLVLEKPNRYAYGITERHWQLAHPIPDNLATLRSEIDRLTL